MAYCTQSDLTKAYASDVLVRMTDDTGAGSVVTAVVDWAISVADAEIDAYLAAKYSVPMSPVPARVKDLCVDITWYHLFSRRGLEAERDPDANVLRRYSAAVAFLRDVAKGLAALGADAPSASGEGAEAELGSAAPVFSRSALKGWL